MAAEESRWAQRRISTSTRTLALPRVLLGLALVDLVWEVVKANLAADLRTDWPWRLTVLDSSTCAAVVALLTGLVVTRAQLSQTMRPVLSWSGVKGRSQEIADSGRTVSLVNAGGGRAVVHSVRYRMLIDGPADSADSAGSAVSGGLADSAGSAISGDSADLAVPGDSAASAGPAVSRGSAASAASAGPAVSGGSFSGAAHGPAAGWLAWGEAVDELRALGLDRDHDFFLLHLGAGAALPMANLGREGVELLALGPRVLERLAVLDVRVQVTDVLGDVHERHLQCIRPRRDPRPETRPET